VSEDRVATYVHGTYRPDQGVYAQLWRCAANATDRVVRWSTAQAVLGVALIAAVVSYEHASALVPVHGGTAASPRNVDLTVRTPHAGWTVLAAMVE
jgi:hypothetical protein